MGTCFPGNWVIKTITLMDKQNTPMVVLTTPIQMPGGLTDTYNLSQGGSKTMTYRVATMIIDHALTIVGCVGNCDE